MTHLTTVPLLDAVLRNTAYLLDLGEGRSTGAANLPARAGRTDLAVLAGGRRSTRTNRFSEVGV
ncbi:hypothetical protein [Micromonospora sp. NPDC005806]|uniref:hypothetical protein n=1 Tax=Micromonospora sp. NPDC005806 TaxID=3364234 RepID=UPI0036A4DAC0